MVNGRIWLVALVGTLALLASVFFAHNPLTRHAQNYAEEVAKASAATYVTLRALNAFMSTAQEIEVGGSLVVSGTAQPLKVLEPIDDTVERIAAVIFGVMVVTSVLAVAMGPVGGLGWGMVALAAGLWLLARRAGPVQDIARRFASYGAFLGLALPLAFLVSSVLADRMTAQVWAKHQQIIVEMTASVPSEDAPADGTESWFQGMQDRLGSLERYQTLAAALISNADALISSYLAILAVYIFRIGVLPLLLMGGFLVIARQLAGRR